MKKIVLELNETLYDKLLCLTLSNRKSFTNLVIEMFERDPIAQEHYEGFCEQEYQKLIREEA